MAGVDSIELVADATAAGGLGVRVWVGMERITRPRVGISEGVAGVAAVAVGDGADGVGVWDGGAAVGVNVPSCGGTRKTPPISSCRMSSLVMLLIASMYGISSQV